MSVLPVAGEDPGDEEGDVEDGDEVTQGKRWPVLDHLIINYEHFTLHLFVLEDGVDEVTQYQWGPEHFSYH